MFGVVFVVVAGVLGLVVLRPESHCAYSGGPDLCPILLVFGLLCSLKQHAPSRSLPSGREKANCRSEFDFPLFLLLLCSAKLLPPAQTFSPTSSTISPFGTESACLPHYPLWPSVPTSVPTFASSCVGSASRLPTRRSTY